MDMTTALRIMELTPSADFEDAREAFRRLAKQHHPDRVRYSPESDANEARMKEINVAFNFLSKELKKRQPEKTDYAEDSAPSHGPAEKGRTSDTEKSDPADERTKSVFSFVRNMGKSFSGFQRRKKAGESRRQRRPGSAGAGPQGRCGHRRKNRSFQTVFNESFRESGRKKSSFQVRGGCRHRSVYNYTVYMNLKKRMASPQGRRDTDPGPVSPVSPVSRIKKVGK